MAKKTFNTNTDLCVDIKTKLISDRIAKMDKFYSGLLLRDSEEHFIFTEANRPSKGSRTPQVYNGRYITITCSKNGRLRLNLKATYITEDFVAKEFTKGLSKELTQALKGLIEK